MWARQWIKKMENEEKIEKKRKKWRDRKINVAELGNQRDMMNGPLNFSRIAAAMTARREARRGARVEIDISPAFF